MSNTQLSVKHHQVRCFVDESGYIWSVDEQGESNYPADIEIVGDRIRILGAKDDLGPGRLIVDEFVLWPSLTSLAAAIEDQPAGSDVSLETVLHTLPKCPQAQCSTQEQLQLLHRLANICGLYDAADVIKEKAGLS